MRDYKILAVSVALSKITHNRGSEGNETLIEQEPAVTPYGVRWTPALSGNALRHRLVRRPGAEIVIQRWDLEKKLGLRTLQFLFHGGSLEKARTGENLARLTDFWRLFPLGRVLGGSLPDMIVGGSLVCRRGVLVCRENAERLARLLPAGFALPETPLAPAERFIGDYQYTRAAASRACAEHGEPGPQVGSTGAMIFSGQTVLPGATFVHGFDLTRAQPRDLGALLASLALWGERSGTIGGMAAKGHGRIHTSLSISPAVDQAEMIRVYLAYLDEIKTEGIAWLVREFGDG